MSAVMEVQQKTQDQVRRDTYKRPPVCVGMNILYWHEGASGPYPALVSAVSDQTIDIIFFPFSAANKSISRPGVRHIGDPNNREIDIQNAGTWDLTAETKAIRETLAKKA